MLLDPDRIGIAGHVEGRTTLNGRGDVLVIIGIVTHAVERAVASTEIAENENRFKPDRRVDIAANVFPLRTSQRLAVPLITLCRWLHLPWSSRRASTPVVLSERVPRVPGSEIACW